MDAITVERCETMNRPVRDSVSTIEQLNRIAMSASERRNACEDLRKAQIFVDLVFVVLSHVSAVAASTSRRKVLMRRLRRFLFGHSNRQRRVARI